MKATSCVSPLIRYFPEMSSICLPRFCRSCRVACSRSSSVLAFSSAVVASSGNLASMIEMPVVRHVDAAIRPRIVRQRELEFIGALRQPVGDDGFHAALAEGAAALLVVEHLLQRRHGRGQIGDVLLRRVDHRQPRMQLLQMVGGVLGRGLHRLADVLRHRVEPRIHGLLQLRVRVLQPAAHGIEPGVELGQALLGRGSARAARAQQQHDDRDDARRR